MLNELSDEIRQAIEATAERMKTVKLADMTQADFEAVFAEEARKAGVPDGDLAPHVRLQ